MWNCFGFLGRIFPYTLYHGCTCGLLLDTLAHCLPDSHTNAFVTDDLLAVFEVIKFASYFVHAYNWMYVWYVVPRVVNKYGIPSGNNCNTAFHVVSVDCLILIFVFCLLVLLLVYFSLIFCWFHSEVICYCFPACEMQSFCDIISTYCHLETAPADRAWH